MQEDEGMTGTGEQKMGDKMNRNKKVILVSVRVTLNRHSESSK